MQRPISGIENYNQNAEIHQNTIIHGDSNSFPNKTNENPSETLKNNLKNEIKSFSDEDWQEIFKSTVKELQIRASLIEPVLQGHYQGKDLEVDYKIADYAGS